MDVGMLVIEERVVREVRLRGSVRRSEDVVGAAEEVGR